MQGFLKVSYCFLLCFFLYIKIMEQITDDMERTAAEGFRHLDDVDDNRKRCSEALESKRRLWGDVVESNGAVWLKNGYPLKASIVPAASAWVEQVLYTYAIMVSDRVGGFLQEVEAVRQHQKANVVNTNACSVDGYAGNAVTRARYRASSHGGDAPTCDRCACSCSRDGITFKKHFFLFFLNEKP